MRTLLLASALLAGCAPAPAFDLTITNVGDETTFLRAGEGTGVQVILEEQVDGLWRGLASSLAALCAPRCGAPPGAISCADAAAELLIVHALLPGDSEVRSWESDDWYFMDETAGCVRQSSLAGTLRATVTHSPTAADFNGDPLPEPTASGPQGAGGGADLVNPTTTVFEFDLVGRTAAVLEVDDG